MIRATFHSLPRPRSAALAVALLAALLAASAQAREIKKPLRFERGASSATVQGAVVRGDRDAYEFKASSGQAMDAAVTALEENAAFVIRAPGGRTLPGAGETDDAVVWKGALPATGTYRIEVGGTRGNAEYTLTVSIH
ncbi:hypothetical protein [Fundidesulfovibrio terrae]|uniref:hypothetical protein n=1 Tax=Fundidesulfovibrio terrae TaxID=2922866 RepID=UPI001FAF8218|nr:hypothetical protein [Fundidesulfovibrio terrae]